MEYHASIDCGLGLEYLKFGVNFTGKEKRDAFYLFYDNLKKGIKYYTPGCDSQEPDGYCKGHEDGSIPRTESTSDSGVKSGEELG